MKGIGWRVTELIGFCYLKEKIANTDKVKQFSGFGWRIVKRVVEVILVQANVSCCYLSPNAVVAINTIMSPLSSPL